MSETSKYILLGFEIATVLSAFLVAFHPNILYASVALLSTFLGVSVLFLFAEADFLAGVQVVVYVGGVTILILFAIMLTQWMDKAALKDVRSKIIWASFAVVAALLPTLLKVLQQLVEVADTFAPLIPPHPASPTTQAIGLALLGPYLLPFEGITILLLGSLVGAVWLARPR